MSIFIDPGLRAFITDNSLDKRKSVSQRVLTQYPERVPIMVGRADLKNTPAISKHKYLVPRDLIFGRFVAELRKNIPAINSEMALFFFVGKSILVPSAAPMTTLYEKYKSEDGFLYIVYSSENTFG